MKITVDAVVDRLREVLAFVDEKLEARGCPLRTQMAIDVAVEELFVNVASYAYGVKTGQVTISMDFEDDPAAVRIQFRDSGIPYNPLAREDPDITLPASKREIGGLGILMVKKSMDDVTYEYRDGQNCLTIRKLFGGGKSLAAKLL